jgi:hypothetical protein
MRYGSRLKCVNVGSHIWRKEEEKKTNWPFSKARRYSLHFFIFDNQNKYFYCSAKFQFSNITKILKLENRRMIINIFLPSWFPISFIRLQFEALKYTIPHNYIFTILYLYLKYLTLSESDEGYSRNATCAIHFISTFLLLSLGWYLCW